MVSQVGPQIVAVLVVDARVLVGAEEAAPLPPLEAIAAPSAAAALTVIYIVFILALAPWSWAL